MIVLYRMRCESCASPWLSTRSMRFKLCPFCGSGLVREVGTA